MGLFNNPIGTIGAIISAVSSASKSSGSSGSSSGATSASSGSSGGSNGYTNYSSSALGGMSDSQLRSLASQNSSAWHSADSGTRDALHAQNVAINNILDQRTGSTSTYDSASGRWSSSGGGGYSTPSTVAPSATYTAGAQGHDRSDYINALSRNPETGDVYSPTGQNMTGFKLIDWLRDKTDYAANALKSKSVSEAQSWLDKRAQKAEAQGIDISGNDPRYKSNSEIYQEWFQTRGQYTPESFNYGNGQKGVGYYGQDENGNFGYYADPERTVKLENGGWDKSFRRNGTQLYSAAASTPAANAPQAQNGAGAVQRSAAAQALYGGGMYGSDDLSDLIRQQHAAALEANLAALKEGYDKSMNGYRDQLRLVPQNYNAARNRAAAQNAAARRTFDERAAASGLSSGSGAQAELSRASAMQAALANIDLQQQNAEDALNSQMAQTAAEYQSAIAQAEAQGNYQLASALYNELVRVQEQQREDAQLSRQYQTQMAQLGAQYGDYSGLNRLGINTASYEQKLAEQAALEAAQREAAASAYTPTFSVSQVQSEINNARKYGTPLSPTVLRDYEYYYGQPYGGTSASASSVRSSSGGGSSAPVSTPAAEAATTNQTPASTPEPNSDAAMAVRKLELGQGPISDARYAEIAGARDVESDIKDLISAGATNDKINNVLSNAYAMGKITFSEMTTLRGRYARGR